MPTDQERKQAMKRAYDLLGRLADRRRGKRIPNEIRLEADAIRHHFPSPAEVQGWDGRPMTCRADHPGGLHSSIPIQES